MDMKNKLLLIALLGIYSFSLKAQHHEQQYFEPTDPLVQEKLDTWQDYKFGLLMHWAPTANGAW